MENENVMKVIGKMEFYGIELDIYGDLVTPWFKADDVAKCIEHSNTSKMVKMVKENNKKVVNLTLTNGYSQDTHGGARETTEYNMVSEFGLYGILFKSRLPKAEEFNEKVMMTLKQIRLTGGYIPINSNDTEETINKKAQEIAQSTIKHKDKLLKQLEDAYKKLEFKYEIEQYKSQLYRTERDEAIQECKELEEDINTLKDIAIESLHLHTKIQGTLGLKDIIIKVTGSSHGWQTYRQWMKDKYDNGLLTDCGISYTRYKLCSKEFIIDCDDIRALEVLQEMFNDFYNPSIKGMTIEL